VNPSDLSNDNDPVFIAEFYKNLKILSQDLYKRSATTAVSTPARPNASLAGAASAPNSSAPPPLQKRMSRLGSLRSMMQSPDAADPAPGYGTGHDSVTKERTQAYAAGGGSSILDSAYFNPASPDYFTQEALHERMKVYAREGGIPMDYIDRYTEYAKNRGSATATSTGAGSAAGGGGHSDESS
jgi:hypothetical protein